MNQLVHLKLSLIVLFGVQLAVQSTTSFAQSTLEVQVSADSDDAEEDDGGGVSVNNDKLELGQMEWVGLRFNAVSIPQGATISSAYVEIRADDSNTESTDLTIFGQDADDAAAFSGGSNNLSSRPRTTASVDWSNVENWSKNQWHDTPGISAIIQEIVNRTGWTSGNDLVILIRSDDLDGKRLAKSHDFGSGQFGAKLHVEYNTAPPTPEIYYVRTDGNDSNTGLGSSTSEAWATVSAAVNKSLNPGDTVYVKAGTYTGTVTPSVDGSSGNPIRFIADRNGTVSGWDAGDIIIQVSGASFGMDLYEDHYLEFVGFEIDAGSWEAIRYDSGDGVVFDKCEIHSSGISGINVNGGSPTFKNCLIRDVGRNGITNDGGTVTIWNTTIVNSDSDGIEQTSGTSTITNCIIINSTDYGLRRSGGTMTHTYNIVWNNSSGNYDGTSASTGELSADPLFAGGGDYHLQSSSPAIDAGTSATGIVDDDLDDNLRPLDGGWEMGCFEYASATSGLVGHWVFDEGSGSMAADSSSSANDATLQSGAIWTTNCSGQSAIEFNGTGANAITVSSFSPPSIGTVAFWMRSAGAPAARSRIFGLGGNWETRQEPDGTLSFDFGAEGPPEFVSLASLDVPDRWYHIVAVFDASDNSFQVYVDGQLDSSGINGDDMVTQSSGQLSFGTRTGSTEYWEGALRDFRIYASKLTAIEVAELYGILAHWKLDETSGTVATDSSGLGNDATYVGLPTLSEVGAFPAKTNTSVRLNGSTHYVSAGTSLLNDVEEFTIAGWFKPSDISPVASFFGQHSLIEVGIDTATNQLELWTSQGGAINAVNQLSPGKWKHIAAVGNGVSLSLYVDGREVATGGTTTADYGNNAEIFKIGEGVMDSSDGYFNGHVDEVQVFNRALCPDQIFQLYKGGRPSGVRILKWIEVR